jgi:hypothetical protein
MALAKEGAVSLCGRSMRYAYESIASGETPNMNRWNLSYAHREMLMDCIKKYVGSFEDEKPKYNHSKMWKEWERYYTANEVSLLREESKQQHTENLQHLTQQTNLILEVVSALKEEKGSEWRDDMTKEEKAVWHRNNVGASQRWLRENHQEKKKERAAAELTAAASSDQPAPGTVTCPYKIRQGANKGKVCGRTDCKHEARLKAQEKAEELEESEETRLKTRVQNTKTFESILFSCYPQEIPDSWVEVMQSGYCRLLTEELPSDLEEVVTRLLRTDTTKPSRGLVQQEVAAIEEAQELGAKI